MPRPCRLFAALRRCASGLVVVFPAALVALAVTSAAGTREARAQARPTSSSPAITPLQLEAQAPTRTMPAWAAPEAGRPPLQDFRPTEFRGHPQVRGIGETSDGLLLFANEGGIFDYDGVRWQHHPAPATFIITLALDPAGRVWVGGDSLVGYFAPPPTPGATRPLIDLLADAPAAERAALGRASTVVVHDGATYWITRSAVRRYAWAEGTWSTHPTPVGSRLLVAAGDLYLTQPDGTVLRWDGAAWAPWLAPAPGRGENAPWVLAGPTPATRRVLFPGAGPDAGFYLVSAATTAPPAAATVSETVAATPPAAARAEASSSPSPVAAVVSPAAETSAASAPALELPTRSDRADRGAPATFAAHSAPAAESTPAWPALAGKTFLDARTLRDGTVALGSSRDGLFLLTPDLQRVRRLDRASGLADNVVAALFEDRTGALWLGFNSGLARLDLAARATTFDAATGLPGVIDVFGRAPDGTLYFGCFEGLFRLVPADPHTGASARLERDPRGMNNIFGLHAHAGEFLVAGRPGLHRLLPDRAELLVPTPGNHAFAIVPSRTVPGRLYLPSNAGFLVVERAPDGTWVKLHENTTAGMTNHGALDPATGDFWAGSYAGHLVRVPGAERLSATAWAQTPVTVERYASGSGLAPGTANALAGPGPRGVEFFTNLGHVRFDPATRSFAPATHLVAGEAAPPLLSFPSAFDRQGRFWSSVASGTTLNVLHPFGHYTRETSPPPAASAAAHAAPPSPASASAPALPLDAHSATPAPVTSGADARWRFVPAEAAAGRAVGFAGPSLLWLDATPLAAATPISTSRAAAAGVDATSRASEPLPATFTSISTSTAAGAGARDVVPADVLWASGSGGTLRLDLAAPAPTLPGWSAQLRGAQLGTRSLDLPPPPAAAAFNSQPSTFNSSAPLRFAYSREPLRLRFAAPLTGAAEGALFQHRLRGFNDTWTPPAATAEATFTNLEGGPFTFEVRAQLPDGRVSAPATLTFTIAPPWHRSPPALVGYALALLGLAAGTVRWRTARLRRERDRLEALVAARTAELATARDAAEAASRAKSSFLAQMSHELRTPLNAIIGYAQLLRRDTPPTARPAPAPDSARSTLDASGRPAAERTAERAAIIHASGQHLLRLINDVLDFAKIEAGKLELRPALIDLPALLAEIAATHAAAAAAKGLAFHPTLPPDLPRWVEIDPAKLRQILDNLLGNAVKFTASGEVRFIVETRPSASVGTPASIGAHPPGLALALAPAAPASAAADVHPATSASVVSAASTAPVVAPPARVLPPAPALDPATGEPLPPTLRCTITDTGPGIDPAEQPRLFRAFEQAAAAAATHAPGTGLGLAISQRLARLLGGAITLASAPGRGARFTVELPLRLGSAPAAADTTASLAATSPPTGYTGPRRRLLLCDDTPTNRALLAELLTPLGFTCEECANGVAALARLGVGLTATADATATRDGATTARPASGMAPMPGPAGAAPPVDLLIVDLKMPGALDGLAVAQAVRAAPATARLPVILTSASVLGFDERAAHAAGCDAFLPKPFEQAVALGLVARLLGLEWTYPVSAPGPAIPTNADVVAAAPGTTPREVFQALEEAAELGEITRVRALLASARAAAPHDPRWPELEALAARFALTELRARLAALRPPAE